MDRRRELKRQYKETKHEMGVYIFRCNPTGKVYMGSDHQVRGTINSITFQLGMGSFRVKTLQADWKEHGPDAFTVEVIEQLDYDEDESKTDYREDLDTLLELCRDRYDNVEVLPR